ncbi:MAG: type II secretion system F family protein [Lachnospiraceae bacterium]|nr:type II secretion system F family protein [Lachnospiraceae bacterium]
MSRIDAADAAVLLGRLSRILRGNISPLSALEIVSEHIEKKALKKTVRRMIVEMKRGESFAEGAYITEAFDPCFLKCVEQAEENHRLPECLERFSGIYGEEEKRENLLRGVVYFPLLIVFTSVFFLILLLVFLYPGFIGLFADTGVKVPALTAFFLSLAHFFREYWVFVALILLALLVLLQILNNSSFGRRSMSRLVFESRLFYSVRRKLLYSQFARFLAALKAEKISDEEALTALAETFDRDIYFSELLFRAAEQLKETNRLSAVLRDSGVFPESFIDMLSLGEELGDVEGYLLETAAEYLAEGERIAEKRIRTWEPLILLVMITILLALVISLALPTTALYESIEGL